MTFIRDSLSGLVNAITGTGTRRDKITHASWYFERPLDSQLSALYRSTWIARKMVDIPIDDMLREGWTWQADDPDVTQLEAEERRLDIRNKLRMALTRDSLYGGGALLLGDGAEDTTKELDPERIGKGGLRYVLALGRGEINVKDFQLDPNEDYGQPTMYEMVTAKGRLLYIHPSRVITFIGQPVTAPLDALNHVDFWGDSRLASVLRDIAAAMSGVAGTGRLMEELAVTYHKMAGLTEQLAAPGGIEQVRAVLDQISLMKSAINSAVIDAEDDVSVITASFAGLPEAVRSLMQNVAGAADIPLTRFLGSSPDGLNATGASDTRNYYDRLAGRRAAYVEPGVARLDEFLIRSALGRKDEAVWRIWNPLWQLSETEQVDLDAKKMDVMTKLHSAAIVHDHVIEQVARTMMIDSPTFQGAETAFEEADEMPDPEPEEVAAANQLQTPSSGQPPAARPPKVVGGTDFGDMAPSPLYVRRDVLNAAEILRWAEAQGVPDLLPAEELHVTILYSKTPVDWFKMGTSWQDKVEVGEGGPRVLEVFGEGALVLRFASDDLRWRHENMIEMGASSDYPEYSPHITLSYSATDVEEIEPYQGKIILGPEIFEPVNTSWKSDLLGDGE